MSYKYTPLLAPFLFLGWISPMLAGQPPRDRPAVGKQAAPAKYIRVLKNDEKEPVALQTATVRFGSAAGERGAIVDLVGVVHIGDREYYKKLNKQFQQYDVVLFELVAPPGTVIPKGGKRESKNPLAFLQSAMKSVLALESQTEQIDYTRKNFVHADLSFEEMGEVIRKRGETGLSVTLNIVADLLRQQNLQDMKKAEKRDGKQAPEPDLLSMLLDPEAGVKLKRVMAEQLAGTEDLSLGKTLNTIIISDRNAAAIKALQKELAKGRKKIAIFYGAAHMPDFQRRLRDEFDLQPQSTQWLDAWDLSSRPGGGLGDLLKQLMP